LLILLSVLIALESVTNCTIAGRIALVLLRTGIVFEKLELHQYFDWI
jgi:hypothetical protein